MFDSTHIISRDRAIYERLKEVFGSDFKIAKTILLRLEEIKNNKTLYKFSYRGTDTFSDAPEFLLPQEDVHVVTAIKLALCKYDKAKKGNFLPYQYPSEEVFGAAQAVDLLAAFNSRLRARLDETIELDNMSTAPFLKIPETQKRAAVANVSAVNTFPQYEWEDGLVELEPALVMNGGRKNLIELSLPEFTSTPAWEAASNNDHHFALYLQGYTISSAAKSHYDQIRDVIRGV